MRILLITDQAPDSNHSAIQGIFNSHLKRYDEVDVVYFDRALAKPIVSGGKLVLPYRYKRKQTLNALKTLTDPASYDVMIVRNFFAVSTRRERRVEPFCEKPSSTPSSATGNPG